MLELLLFGGGFDPDADAWARAVMANGGSASRQQRGLVSRLIRAEKASGAWYLTLDYWLWSAENRVQACMSLKRRVMAQEVSAPVFTPFLGYANDGVSSCLNTQCTPSTDGAAIGMTASNLRLGIWERTDVGTGYSQGTSSGTVMGTFALRARSAASTAIGIANNNVGGSSYTLPANTSIGYFAAGRNGVTAADCYAYKSGVALTRTVDATAFGAILPAQPLVVGGDNRLGTVVNFRPNTVGITDLGITLSPSQELARFNAYAAYMAAIGA